MDNNTKVAVLVCAILVYPQQLSLQVKKPHIRVKVQQSVVDTINSGSTHIVELH